MSEEELNVHETLESHEGRIRSLEEFQMRQEQVNSDIRNKLTDTENTVLKEGGKQQEMIQKLLDHVLGSKTFSQQQFWKVAAIAAGSGGVIYTLIELASR